MLDQIRPVAERVVDALRPHSLRIEIAGSIRREKRICKDIEIVCIPQLKDGTKQRSIRWIGAVIALGRITKGKPRDGKYVQIRLPEGVNLDLFMCRPENWGYIFAIRTGSADFSHRILASGWVKAGYEGGSGMLTRNGIPIDLPEEADLFHLIGLQYIEPRDREL